MLLRQMILAGCACAAMTAIPAAAAMRKHSCVAGPPTAASYTWNFQKEADGLFQKIQNEALDARDAADRLQSYNRGEVLDWQAQSYKLNDLKADIDQMGRHLCRLAMIRRALAPWQRQTVDRVAVDLRLMADNTQDAILYMNHNQHLLWLGTYQKYVNNLYNESDALSHSAGTAVEYANVRHEFHQLQGDLKRS